MKTLVSSSLTASANLRTRSSAELERDPVKVEVARSNRAGFTIFHADVAQWQEAPVLGTGKCGFESLRRYQVSSCRGAIWQTRTVESREVEGSSPSDSTKFVRFAVRGSGCNW